MAMPYSSASLTSSNVGQTNLSAQQSPINARIAITVIAIVLSSSSSNHDPHFVVGYFEQEKREEKNNGEGKAVKKLDRHLKI